MSIDAPGDFLRGLAGFPLYEAVEHTGLGVLAADAHGRITVISPALRELFHAAGADLDDLVIEEPRPGLGLIHVDGTPMTAEETPLGRALCGEFVKNALIGTFDLHGELLWLEANGMPLYDGDVPAGGVVVLQDVTAQRRSAAAEDELRARLVHAVNHEFRTPLAALLGNLEVVRDHHEIAEGTAGALDAIERAAWRLCHLVGTAATLIERQEQLHQDGLPPDRIG